MIPFFKSDMIRNVLSLLTGNTVAQALGLIIYPILTRLYDAEAFGELSLFLSAGGLMVVCANVEIQNSILISKSDREARACFHGGMCVVCVVSVLLFGVCHLLSRHSLFGIESLGLYVYLLPLFVFLTSSWQLFNAWFSREKEFNNISEYQIVTSSSNSALKTFWRVARFPYNGLIISSVISPFISLLLALFSYRKKLHHLKYFDFRLSFDMLLRYKNFPLYSFPRSLVCFFSGNLTVFLLSCYFDMGHIGLLSMALTLAFRPVNMISSSLYQVFFQKCSEAKNKGEDISSFIRNFTSRTLIIIVPVFLILSLIIPYVIPILLSEEWSEVSKYIIYLMPWIVASAVVAPISFLSDIFSAQREALLFEILILIFRFAGLYVGVIFDDFGLSILMYSLFNVVVLALQYLWYISLIRKRELK